MPAPGSGPPLALFDRDGVLIAVKVHQTDPGQIALVAAILDGRELS